MRKIISGLYMTLDGIVSNSDKWGINRFLNQETIDSINEGLQSVDTVLLGKKTYLNFSTIWTNPKNKGVMADFLNKSHKYVASKTLNELSWQPATLIKNNLFETLHSLKKDSGKNILIPGSPTLVRSLLLKGLLDVLTFNIFPVVAGSGMHFFGSITDQIDFKLIYSKTLTNGVIEVSYQPLYNPN